jgi:hypothetical protein
MIAVNPIASLRSFERWPNFGLNLGFWFRFRTLPDKAMILRLFLPLCDAAGVIPRVAGASLESGWLLLAALALGPLALAVVAALATARLISSPALRAFGATGFVGAEWLALGHLVA